MILRQPPERLEWEEKLFQAMVLSGFCRSDAQSIVEVKPQRLNEMYEQGLSPEAAAKLYTD